MPERFDLLVWYASPDEEERRNVERWGVEQPPTVLGYGIELDGHTLTADILTVIRPLRAGVKRVTLYRDEGKGKRPVKRTVRVQWGEPLTPARWGDATFQVVE